MKIEMDGFSFDFSDAIDAFIFDEKDESKATYHGLPMKSVDIIVELASAYLFVEMKDFDNPELYKELSADNADVNKEKHGNFQWLKNYLKYKYRDSYLFRHAEDKVDKPIYYICLLTFDNVLNNVMQKSLSQELPVGLASKRWKKAIVENCQVVNVVKWNKNFPQWPVTASQEK